MHGLIDQRLTCLVRLVSGGTIAFPETLYCVVVFAEGVGGCIPQLSRPHRCGVCV